MDRPRVDRDSRRTLVRIGLAVLLALLLLPMAYSAANPQSVDLGPGTVDSPADNETYVSIQGFHFAGYGDAKKPARLVAADENAEPKWSFDGDEVGSNWFYEVNPLDDGNLYVTSTYPERDGEPGGTIVFEYDPEAEEPVWTHDIPGALDTHATHDLPGDEIVVAQMRNTEDGVSNDRLYVENTTTGDEEWEWLFRDHYDNDTDGGFSEDWTHVNDVDPIDEEGRYLLASPRNFDQAIVVDRETDDIVMQLGEDDDYEVLNEQHNPDYFERDDGTPVMLVADSENDRVVEFERDCGDADPRLGAGTPPEECEWEQTWEVDGFNWPRDADRLENGNTLVTDTLNHRVVELNPEGEVVWEFYAAWAPYDAERGAEESNGPAMSEQGGGGSYTVSGGGDGGPASRYEVADAIADAGGAVGTEERGQELASRWAHLEPWLRPAWMGSWAFLSTVLAVLLAVGWAGGEVVVNRRRIVGGVRNRIRR